ncbi:MAG: amidase, partial [Armatimonadetes bacterium]|nr:amidase [Armatimonadota bacterium]
VFGVTRNPWKLDRTPGGSSGGAAAAVAAGLGPIAEGSDGGGSVRIPASLSGVVGFKPSQGRIPRHPNQNAWATLSVHGPLARTVADAALMFAVMAGPDDRDPLCAGDTGEDFLAAAQGDASLRGLRVAWTPDFDGVVPVDPEVREVAEAAVRAFEDLGAAVTPASPDVRKARAIFEVVATYPRHTTLAPHLAEWREHLDPVLLRRAEHLGRFTAADVAQAEVERTALCLGMAKFFQSCDLLVLPTTAVPAFSTAGYPREVAGRPITSPYADDIWLLTMAFNLTGQPAISVPCGWTADGLPVGLQIVGRRLADALVLRAAAAFEAARPWAASRPPL